MVGTPNFVVSWSEEQVAWEPPLYLPLESEVEADFLGAVKSLLMPG